MRSVAKRGVPEGCVFVMGGDRSRSDDGRQPALGMAGRRLLIGRAYAVLPLGKLFESVKEHRNA